MNTPEREQRLTDIRGRMEVLRATGNAPAFWAGDADWLLSELDAACKALHDLREETGYAEGFKDGLEEGARQERARRDLAVPRMGGLRRA